MVWPIDEKSMHTMQVPLIVLIHIDFNKWNIYNNFLAVSGYSSIHMDTSQSDWSFVSHQMTSEINVLLIKGVVKGYHECPMTVRMGEIYSVII